MADIIRPIEPFELTQIFGVNPQNYAQFGLAGHNGWDFRTKFADTPLGHRDIFASWMMDLYKIGWDPLGYGNYFETVCQLTSTWKLTFGHCLSIENFKTKKEGESMAVSDSTGNSTGAHLHFTVKRIKIVSGVHQVQDYNNGYFGAVDPQQFFDELRAYKQTGAIPKPLEGLTMQIDDTLYAKIITKATNRDDMRAYLGLPQDPTDPTIDKEKAVIEGYKNLATGLQSQLAEAKAEVANREEQVDRIKQTYEASAKTDQDRITALEKAQKSWVTERDLLKGQVEDFGKAKGELVIENEQLKTKLKTAQDGSTEDLTLAEVLMLLFKKAATIKLR